MKKRTLLRFSKRYLFSALLLLSIPFIAFSEQGLKVVNNSGGISTFSFSNLSKLTFVNETMSVLNQSGGLLNSYSLTNVRLLSFGDVMASGLTEQVSKPEISVYPNPAANVINIRGVESGTVTIYSIVGAKVMETVLADGANKIDVSALNPGVYVIFINGKSVKFAKE